MYFAPFPFLLRGFTLERPSSLVLYKEGTSFANNKSGQRAVRWDKTVFAIEQILDFYIPICGGERAISLSEGGVVAMLSSEMARLSGSGYSIASCHFFSQTRICISFSPTPKNRTSSTCPPALRMEIPWAQDTYFGHSSDSSLRHACKTGSGCR